MDHVLVLDLDDTLIPSSTFYKTCIAKLGLDEAEYALARKQVKAQLSAESPSSHNRLLYFKRLLENKGQFSSEKASRMMDAYENFLVNEIQNYWQNSDRGSLLLSLSEKYKLALLTNETTRIQLLKLNCIDPKGLLFSWVITSEEIGAEKPNKLMFTELIRRARLEKNQNIIMVGDDLDNDIVPAAAHGWRGILTTEFKPENKALQNIEMVESLADLPYKL